jgi:hypothetical protein
MTAQSGDGTMSEPTFPPDLIKRCAHAAASTITGPDYWSTVAEKLLRESGHAELVAAVKEGLELAREVRAMEPPDYEDGGMEERMVAALLQAGAAPRDGGER